MPAIARRGGGSIVITASTSGIRAVPGIAPYICSKHAVIGLMRSGAMEGAASAIRVNTVNPSPIETPMIERLEDRSEEHTSELQSLMRISYAVFCLKKKKT